MRFNTSVKSRAAHGTGGVLQQAPRWSPCRRRRHPPGQHNVDDRAHQQPIAAPPVTTAPIGRLPPIAVSVRGLADTCKKLGKITAIDLIVSYRTRRGDRRLFALGRSALMALQHRRRYDLDNRGSACRIVPDPRAVVRARQDDVPTLLAWQRERQYQVEWHRTFGSADASRPALSSVMETRRHLCRRNRRPRSSPNGSSTPVTGHARCASARRPGAGAGRVWLQHRRPRRSSRRPPRTTRRAPRAPGALAVDRLDEAIDGVV